MHALSLGRHLRQRGIRLRQLIRPYVARLRHTLQLQYADRALGAVLDRLRELGTYDESLIVVTADHGVAFTQDSAMRGVSDDNYEEILWTPLLVKAPGQERAEVDDVPVQTIDILPTLAAMLGVDLPDEVDGVPAGERVAGTESDERLMLDYRFHDLHPTGDDDFVRFDAKMTEGDYSPEALRREGVR